MDLFNSILTWVPLLGAGGIGVAAWLIGIPALLGILNNALTIITPLAKGISEFVVWYISNLWDGIKVVLANTSTFVVIATIAAGSGYAAMQHTKGKEATKCKTQIVQTQKKCPTAKKATKSEDDWNPFDWLK